jgi:hypothetical protein
MAHLVAQHINVDCLASRGSFTWPENTRRRFRDTLLLMTLELGRFIYSISVLTHPFRQVLQKILGQRCS